jgi:hypothetical protein
MTAYAAVRSNHHRSADAVVRPCEHPGMTSDGVVPRPQQTLAVAVLVAMASGIVVAIGDIASVPVAIVAPAASAFMVSVVVFGIVTYRDARSSCSPFGSALRRSLRTVIKVLFALMS